MPTLDTQVQSLPTINPYIGQGGIGVVGVQLLLLFAVVCFAAGMLLSVDNLLPQLMRRLDQTLNIRRTDAPAPRDIRQSA